MQTTLHEFEQIMGIINSRQFHVPTNLLQKKGKKYKKTFFVSLYVIL